MKTQIAPASSQEAASTSSQRSRAAKSTPGITKQRHLQLQTIAVLTDLDINSEKSLHYAASLAQWYRSRLLVAHASLDVNPYLSPQPFPAWPAGVVLPIEDVRGKIECSISSAGLQNVSAEVIVNKSSISDLLKELEGHRPHLLILATHGREGIKKLLIGSITEEVFRKVQWPVLVLGPHTQSEWSAPVRFRKVLCTIDLSEASVNALRYAVALAEDHESQLNVLHVEAGSTEGFSFDRIMALQALRDWVHSHVLAQGEALRKAEYEIEFGQPENQVLKAAAEFQPDVIVLGARGLGAKAGVASHFVGGTAYEVATRSDCPVLIVPRPR